MRRIESKSLALYKNLINDSENSPIICEPSGPSSELFNSFGNSDAQRIYEVLRSYLQVWVNVLHTGVGSGKMITNPTLFRAIMLVFPFVAGRVADRFGLQFTVQNFEEILKPLQKLRKSDVQRPGATHLALSDGFRRRLESGFSIGGASTI